MQDIKDITAITAAMLRGKAREAASPRQDLILIIINQGHSPWTHLLKIKNFCKREAQA